jgi:hypothetical protein
MDACLKAMLNKTITVRTVTAYTAEGNETLSAPTSVPAYVEVKRSYWQMGNQGTSNEVKHLVITEYQVGLEDRIWLPGDDTLDASKGKRPESVDVFNDVYGAVDHYEVTL